MKNFLLIAFMGFMLAFMANTSQPQTLDQNQQVTTIAQGIQTPAVQFEPMPVISYEMADFEIVQIFTPGVQCAGVFMFTDAQAEDVTGDVPDDTGQKNSIGLILSNWTVIFGFLFALSEILALIPVIKQNGIFQAIFGWLKSQKKE